MASYAIGLNSSVTLPSGHNGAIRSGRISLVQAPVEVTNTGSAGAREFVGGIESASGTAVATPKYSGGGTSPGWSTKSKVPVAMTVTVASGAKYDFNAIMSQIEHGFDYAGRATVTFNYVSSGAITETWA